MSVLSGAFNMIPVLGTVKSYIELSSGNDLFTGARISQSQAAFNVLASALPFTAASIARFGVQSAGRSVATSFASAEARVFSGSSVNIGGVTKTASPANVRIRTGSQGELLSAFAKIESHNIGQGTATNVSSRAFARRLGKATDDAGHAIGNNLGGLGGVRSGNIFPQTPSVNRGSFAQFEQQIARRVQAGDNVFSRVVPRYEGGSTRPYEILYQVRINGKTINRTFGNP